MITSADLAELRRLEHNWQATDHNVERVARMLNFQASLLNHAPAILDAAEAICLLLAARRDPIGSDVDRAERVEQILAELEARP